MSQVLLIVRGVPGSGKSTYAKKWVSENPQTRTRVNRDDLRNMVYNRYELEPGEENYINKLEQSLIVTALQNKKSVVVDNVNLKRKYVQPYLKIAADYNVPVIHKDIYVDLDTVLTRNKNRDRVVPEHVIHKMWKNFGLASGKFPDFPTHQGYEFYVPDVSLPKAVLLDVDGTAMLMSPGRGPFDWHKVLDDTPNIPVVETAKALSTAGYKIVVVSGREDTGNCREDTLVSLEVAGVPVDDIFMRPEGDWRKDNLVKQEIFVTHIAPKYQVVFALDDRQQVVDMYRREMGIPVFQVNYGNF